MPGATAGDGRLFVGLMSGTSVDAVDAALVRCGGAAPLSIVHARSQAFPAALRDAVLGVLRAQGGPFAVLGRLDVELGRVYADAVLALLAEAGVAPAQVRAIGSHGQTVHHAPDGDAPFTWQLGDPYVIAVATGIDVVADFRRRDVALGGQGAPLAPGFHDAVFRHPARCRVVLNLGGIANISVLAPGRGVTGHDTGPANGLMDAWMQARRGAPFDRDGAFALTGRVDDALLQRLRADDYFARPPPKSTGRERFHLGWLQARLQGLAPAPGDADVMRTLLELTASTVADAVDAAAADGGELLVCGGGARNAALMARLAARLPRWRVGTTAAAGVEPEWVEAAAFAVFAQRTVDGLDGNVPAVTGAARPCLLGAVYRP